MKRCVKLKDREWHFGVMRMKISLDLLSQVFLLWDFFLGFPTWELFITTITIFLQKDARELKLSFIVSSHFSFCSFHSLILLQGSWNFKEGKFSCHGIRSMSSIWIVVGHRDGILFNVLSDLLTCGAAVKRFQHNIDKLTAGPLLSIRCLSLSELLTVKAIIRSWITIGSIFV